MRSDLPKFWWARLVSWHTASPGSVLKFHRQSSHCLRNQLIARRAAPPHFNGWVHAFPK
jgi:hypothetical protein